MWLRDIIPGIVFKLDMQFGAYSLGLAETNIFLQMTKYYFYYMHSKLQSYEDTGNKNTIIWYEV